MTVKKIAFVCRHCEKELYEAGPAITFNVGKWGSSGQFCSDRPKTSDLDVSDHLVSEAIEP